MMSMTAKSELSATPVEANRTGSIDVDPSQGGDPELALRTYRDKANDLGRRATTLAAGGQHHLAHSVAAQARRAHHRANALEGRIRGKTAIEQARVAADSVDTTLLALGGVLGIHQDAPGALHRMCGENLDESAVVPAAAIRKRLDRDVARVEDRALDLTGVDKLAAAAVARVADTLRQRAHRLMAVIDGAVVVGELTGNKESARVLLLALAHVFIAADERRSEQAAAVAERASEAARVRAELDAGSLDGETRVKPRRTAAGGDSTKRPRVAWRDTPVPPEVGPSTPRPKPKGRSESAMVAVREAKPMSVDTLRALMRAGTNS
jgi:hypothetical protein